MDIKRSKPEPKTFSQLMLGIENGTIKIPRFQREFVWTIDKTAKLLDSILKGYSIGAFILWATDDKVDYIERIGDIEFPEAKPRETPQYVLDGQQRIVSLYAAYKGGKILQAGTKTKVLNYGEQIYVDLSIDIKCHNNEPIITHKKLEKNPEDIISLREILNYTDSYISEIVRTKYSKYSPKITDYYNAFHKLSNFSVDTFCTDREEGMETAIEVFTRINMGGKRLEIFDIMAAKYYAADRFDMRKKWEEFIDGISEFGPISNHTILHLLPLIMGKKECRQRDKLDLDKKDLIDWGWDTAEKLISTSLDYLQEAFKIKSSRFLPYDTLLVPLAYFFHKNKGEPVGKQKKYFEEFFWKASLSERYSSGVETKLAQDARSMEKIKSGEKPTFDYVPVISEPEHIVRQRFSAGKSVSKAIMCLLAQRGPKSLKSCGDVIVDNSWYVESKRKNCHHFFPKEYLKKHPDKNSLANITLISQEENQSIGAKAPFDYINDYKSKGNDQMAKSLKHHFIDFDDFEKQEIAYEDFLVKRSKAIFGYLEPRLNPK